MQEMTDASRTALSRRLPLLLILAAAIAGAVFLRDELSFEALSANREALIAFRDANYGLTVLVFIAAYTAIVGLSLPGGTVATLTGGFLFGTFPGVLFNVGGATLGATLIFLAVRRGFGESLSARIDASQGAVRRIKAGLEDNQWSMLFLIRLVPAVPFFVANLIPALLAVPLHRYVITTFLGIMPAALVFTSVGAGLGEVFANDGAPDLGVLFTPTYLLPLLGLCALALLPVIVKAARRGRGA
jgi:uncharacterized membrane protein YdjX (TVP38/TMEM64 family)